MADRADLPQVQRGVLGEWAVAKDAEGDAEEPRADIEGEVREGLGVSLLNPDYQTGVCGHR